MDTEFLDTEATLGQQPAPNSATPRPAEEFSGHHSAAAIGPSLHAWLDDHAKSSDATIHAPLLAKQFAAIVYFAAQTDDGRGERRSSPHRTAGGLFDAESVCSTRGRQTPTRPWRLHADNAKP